MKMYVSNKAETPRMFQTGFMEFFSRVHWTVPLWVFLPVIAVCGYLTFGEYKVPALSAAGLFLAGIFVWTFAEYILHRFVFHYEPKSQWGKKIHWTLHGVHHDYPSDPLRLVMVPAVSVPLAGLFYVLFALVFGGTYAPIFMAGFILGYLWYDMTHYAIHHFPVKGKMWGKVREHHMRHHFKDMDRGYGVSNPLWDFVFGTTYAQKERAISEPAE